MGRSEPDERYFAICVAKGRLYRVGNSDEVMYTDDDVDRPLRIGQWVLLVANEGEISKITEVSDYVPTEVRDGVVYLDVKIEFRQSIHDCALHLARCSELSEDILVPPTVDMSVFDKDEEYGMIITLASQSEMNFYHYETGGDTRWKLFLGTEETYEEVHRPPKRKGLNSNDPVTGVVRRTGIIVGVSASGRTQYVYTPEEPVGVDGLISTGQGESVQMGDWIKFDVDAEEAQRIFVKKEKTNFNVLEYRKTDPLLPTIVNDRKGSIELTLEDFCLAQECRTVSSRGAPMIRHPELGLIADAEQYLTKFRIGSRLNIQIARTRQVKEHGTIWAVISAKINKNGTTTRKPLVEVKRTIPVPSAPPPVDPVPPVIVAPKITGEQLDWRNYKSSGEESKVKLNPAPAKKTTAKKPSCQDGRMPNKMYKTSMGHHQSTGDLQSVASRKIRNDGPAKKHRAFVTGISPIKTYLWVVDDENPRRSTMYILGDKNPLKMGQWIEGEFKNMYISHEKRMQFVCLLDSFKSVETPADIDTRRSRDDDGFQMVVVRLNVSYSEAKKCMVNKYIGEITDPRCLVPRDTIDREMFGAVITLTRRASSSHYDWTIERLEPASSCQLQCRNELEKKVKSVMETREAKKEKKGKENYEGDVARKMSNMSMADNSKSKSYSRSTKGRLPLGSSNLNA